MRWQDYGRGERTAEEGRSLQITNYDTLHRRRRGKNSCRGTLVASADSLREPWKK